jgi:protein SCO1/2
VEHLHSKLHRNSEVLESQDVREKQVDYAIQNMQLIRVHSILAFVVLSAGMVGCGNSAAPPDERSFAVKGKVVAVDRDKKQVTLDHEDIPGLMKAMKMPFAVETEQLLDNLHVGDDVQGRLKVVGGNYTITELKAR